MGIQTKFAHLTILATALSIPNSILYTIPCGVHRLVKEPAKAESIQLYRISLISIAYLLLSQYYYIKCDVMFFTETLS